MILLDLHKLSGKDGLCPSLIWIMGLLEIFFIFDGLRVLVFKERLWVVDIVK